MINPEFWRGKRVFLTGHTGFKGSWLALWLQEMEASLHGYALAPETEPSLFNIADVASGMRSQIGDIRDADGLRLALRTAQPEVVLHLAAQPLVRKSYLDPVETYSTNVMGLVHLLEAVRTTDSVRVVVNVTSDKCYENYEWPYGYRENDAMGGHDPTQARRVVRNLSQRPTAAPFFQIVKTPRLSRWLALAPAMSLVAATGLKIA